MKLRSEGGTLKERKIKGDILAWFSFIAIKHMIKEKGEKMDLTGV